MYKLLINPPKFIEELTVSRPETENDPLSWHYSLPNPTKHYSEYWNSK